MTRTIPLTRGYVALVDDEDYEWLSQWNWHALVSRNVVYAVRKKLLSEYDEKSHSHSVVMHRALLELGGLNEVYVDHINHDGLDNRKVNLRAGSQSQNLGNQRKGKGVSSQFKGVYWSSKDQRWRAEIKVNTVRRHLGSYSSERQAAEAYDVAALEAWGDCAYLNFRDS